MPQEFTGPVDERQRAKPSSPPAQGQTSSSFQTSLPGQSPLFIQRRPLPPSGLTGSSVLQLQRLIGNRAVSQLLAGQMTNRPAPQPNIIQSSGTPAIQR